LGGINLSQKDIEYLSVEISPIMRATAVDNISEMQWTVDIINLSNIRRGDSTELFEAKRDKCMEKVKELPLSLKIVKNHEELILECIKPTFWDSATEGKLDQVIHDLGPLMKHRDPSRSAFRILDLRDTVRIRTWLELDGKTVPKTKYQEIVASFISGLAIQSEAVRKVRDGVMVTANEIEEIILLFEGCEHPISVDNLREAWGAKRVSLEDFLAHILRGEDLPDWETKVRGEFEAFLQEHSTFNPRQIEMLNTLCTYVINNEAVAITALVKAPFTQFDSLGLPGVFEKNQVKEILSFTEALTA
jgi:type I site-specific restriction endonuclease